MNSYKDLKVWQKSMDLVEEIYRITAEFPKSEIYGLSSQMQRAAVAIPSNIAEGQKRNHTKEFLQFLHISYGSGAELETQIEICKRLPKLNNFNYNEAENLLNEIMRMMNAMISAVKKNQL